MSKGVCFIASTASEKQYEHALQPTLYRIKQSWAARSLVDEYQGPQSYIHMSDARSHYRILEKPSSCTAQSDIYKSGMITCVCCTKKRYVDAHTLAAYGTRQFLHDEKEARRQALRKFAQSFKTHMVNMLHQHVRLVDAQRAVQQLSLLFCVPQVAVCTCEIVLPDACQFMTT